jgi:hypothetical protein
MGVLFPPAGLLTSQVLMLQPKAHPEPPPSEAQGYEPNPMPGPTVNSPRPMPEDTELEFFNEDSHLFAVLQDHDEHFMLMGGVSGCVGQDCCRFSPVLFRCGILQLTVIFPSEDPSCPLHIAIQNEPVEKLYSIFS